MLQVIVLKGDVEGHIGKGRSKAECMIQIRKDMNKENYKDFKELSYDREAKRAATN